MLSIYGWTTFSVDKIQHYGQNNIVVFSRSRPLDKLLQNTLKLSFIFIPHCTKKESQKTYKHTENLLHLSPLQSEIVLLCCLQKGGISMFLLSSSVSEQVIGLIYLGSKHTGALGRGRDCWILNASKEGQCNFCRMDESVNGVVTVAL